MKLSSIISLAAVAAITLGLTAAVAAENPILARQALMKANGKEAKISIEMIKGKVPFSLAKAKKVFATFENAANKMPNLFPPDSKTGHHTRASAKIWTHMADVKARFKKLGEDAKTASASVTDLASFKKAFANIGRNDCGACHRRYRLKKDLD